MELEDSRINFKPESDKRPHMPEPPPVRLVAVEDVHLQAATGLEVELDGFYVQLLRFERETAPRGQISYKSETTRLIITIVEPPFFHADMRAIGIDVPSLNSLQHALVEREIEFEYLRGLNAGSEHLLLQDPAGNWVQIGEFRIV